MSDFEQEQGQDQGQNHEPESLRDTLLAAVETSEAGAVDASQDAGAAQRARDEQGRFAAAQAQQQAADPAAVSAEPKPSLTTWRREFIPLQEKLAAGLPLTNEEAKKLADYNVQREREYSTGISTYKAEAQNAKEIGSVLQEFMPALQQHNMNPAAWIQSMGRTHQVLVYGSPEQKLNTFANLARSYGIPLELLSQVQRPGGADQNTMALLHEIQGLKTKLGEVTDWRQGQEQQTIQQEIAKFEDATKYPQFALVRSKMGQLLETNMASGLDEAYEQAVRLVPEAWAAEQQRQAGAAATTQRATSAAVVAKARKAGVSVRTGTPAGSGAVPATDLRGAIAAAVEAHGD